MLADVEFSLFSRFTHDCENIIRENYHYYSTVTNVHVVQYWAYTHCLSGNKNRIAGNIGGNYIWRIVRKSSKIEIGGF